MTSLVDKINNPAVMRLKRLNDKMASPIQDLADLQRSSKRFKTSLGTDFQVYCNMGLDLIYNSPDINGCIWFSRRFLFQKGRQKL